MNFYLNEIGTVAQLLLKKINCKTILFYGDMGVGKTTLISALVKALGGTVEASSPTFSIVNEYQVTNDIVYHFDMYRINNIEEALDFGIEEYIYSDKWVFIEWPDKVDALLPKASVKIHLEALKNSSRHINLELA